jgi:DNA-binding LytR/AlgR family response regulator
MNCLIVDDEPLAQDIIENYILKVPFLTLQAKCPSAFAAMEAFQKYDVDLIFLDIHMPQVNGIDFMNSLERKPMVIFTTGFPEYAIESYELNAIDYLLKPISFNRFLKAVNKAFELFNLRKKEVIAGLTPLQPKVQSVTENFLLVKADYQTIRVDLNAIIYIEGLKDYVKIYTNTSKPIVTLNTLKNLAEKLPASDFIRIHKSYIVSVSRIQFISRGRIIIGEKTIPLGENYKEAFNKLTEKHNITK